MIVFDIETGPLPEEQLRQQFTEPELPPHPGEFQESAVKVGNLKDAVKIREKIEAARTAHAAAVAGHEANQQAARQAAWNEFVSKAALSALTGRLLAIGYHSTDSGKTLLDIDDNESAMLGRFWGRYKACREQGRKLVGHNISGFDVPFIVRRCWLLGFDAPSTVLDKGRWLDPVFIDTMQVWGCGQRDPVKLDVIARAFGVGAKPDGIDGSMFADLLKVDPEKAKAYLANDIEMTTKVAERMGIL